MAQRSAPGVYTTIIDLSDYVTAVNSTIGFLPIICNKGRDNQLVMCNAEEFYKEFGEPNYFYHYKTFSQGPYVASNFLKESDNLYVIRCMPFNQSVDDTQSMVSATFANYSVFADGSNRTSYVYVSRDASGHDTSSIGVGDEEDHIQSSYLKSSVLLAASGPLMKSLSPDYSSNKRGPDHIVDMCTYFNNSEKPGYFVIYGTGRGSYYNDYQINIYRDPNYKNTWKEKYLYRKLADGRLSPLHMDFSTVNNGGSLEVKIVLTDAEKDLLNNTWNPGHEPYSFGANGLVNKDQIYLIDIFKKQMLSQNEDSAYADYNVIGTFEVSLSADAKDRDGESMYIKDVINNYTSDLKCMVNDDLLEFMCDIAKTDICFNDASGGFGPYDTSWVGTFEDFNNNLRYVDNIFTLDASGKYIQFNDSSNFAIYTDFDITYSFQSYYDSSNQFHIANIYGLPLSEGDDGSLFDPETTTEILSRAYLGTLPMNTDSTHYVSGVLDTENYYFNIVMDGGYPYDVKTQIYDLVRNRRDCIAIIDNGDNRTAEDALSTRTTVGSGSAGTAGFNSRYLAIYEPYTKIYDSWTGRDIWITPVYHMANIIPYTDNVSELWFAPAGYNRASVADVKDMRFNPSLGERDLFYQNQLNPIVRFNDGYVVWGQLTSQRRASALQDINVVRLVLYIKRALENFCKFYIFEQNIPDTWQRIQAEVVSFLQQLQNKKALRSFNVNVYADAYMLKAKKVAVDVTLVPVKVIEQINLNFFIQ